MNNHSPLRPADRREPTSNDNIIRAERQMLSAAKALSDMADDVGDARTVREFSSDRHKRALSSVVVTFLDQGESAAASDHKARASSVYASQLADLSEQFRAAMRVLEKADAQRVMFDAARSILSTEKAKMGLL